MLAPLCSDSFSGWQTADPSRDRHNQEAREATDHLINKIIPQFAQELNHRNIRFFYYFL